MARALATFCPTCKGIMRPRQGVLECLHCSDRGRARSVLAKGRRIPLGQGQASLTSRSRPGVEPPLQPRRSQWRPTADAGQPHPQLGLFPFDGIRPGQKRFTRDVTTTIARGGHLVAEAPTGIGKTAASLAPALADAIENGRTVMFLTSRQSQHRIAVDTLRQVRERRGARFTLVDLVSKRDMCLRPEAQDMFASRFPDFCATETRNRTCPFLGEVAAPVLQQVQQGVFHVEELMQSSKDHGLCPHIVAMAASRDAQVVVADYNHLFSDIRQRSLEKLGVQLRDVTLIVDEAHNLPDRIRQNHAHRINAFLLAQVESEARLHRFKETLADVAALRKTLQALADAATKEGRARQGRLDDAERLVATLEVDALHATFEHIRSHGTLGLRRTLADAMEDLGPLVARVRKGTDGPVQAEALQRALEDWGRFRRGALRYVEWDGDEVALHVRLLDPAVAAQQVFQEVHASILMSGTLRPPEVLRDVLGLEEARTQVRAYPSPFPPEHRMLAVVQGTSTRYASRGEEQWQRMAGHVAQACAAVKGNVALFAPSYAILRALRPFLDTRKEVIEEDPDMGKAERDRVLDTLEGARRRGGALLLGVLGGSFSEGIDFRDNLLSVVLVAGLPLAPPDLQVEATIAYYEQRFPGRGRLYAYVVPAMNKVLQAMGRGIRSSLDKCAILLLDERYQSHPYRGFLPAPVVTTDPAPIVARFAQAHGL